MKKVKGITIIDLSQALADSGDLEPATKTITATAEASGLENANYSVSLAVTALPSSYAPINIAYRHDLNITAITERMYLRVYVDVQDDAHRLINIVEPAYYGSTGASKYTREINLVDFPTIFNLIKDGSTHTYYFFFWKNAGSATIDFLQMRLIHGACKSLLLVGSVTCKAGLVLPLAQRSVTAGNQTFRWLPGESSDVNFYYSTLLLTSAILIATPGLILTSGTLKIGTGPATTEELAGWSKCLVIVREEE